MKSACKLAVGALAVALMLVVAMPASAHPTFPGPVRLKTTDAKPGGSTMFWWDEFDSRWFRLLACDDEADGYSVRAYASYTQELHNLVRDVGGANNGCTSAPVSVAPGRTVYVKVCLHKRGDRYCSSWGRFVHPGK